MSDLYAILQFTTMTWITMDICLFFTNRPRCERFEDTTMGWFVIGLWIKFFCAMNMLEITAFWRVMELLIAIVWTHMWWKRNKDKKKKQAEKILSYIRASGQKLEVVPIKG